MATMPLEMLMASLMGGQQLGAQQGQVPIAPPVDPLEGLYSEQENILSQLASLGQPEPMPLPPEPGKAQFALAAIADALNAAAAVKSGMVGLQTRNLPRLLGQREERQQVERLNVRQANEAKRQGELIGAQARLGAVQGKISAQQEKDEASTRYMREKSMQRDTQTFQNEQFEAEWRNRVSENEKDRALRRSEFRASLGAQKANDMEVREDEARALASLTLQDYMKGDPEKGVMSLEEVAAAGPAAAKRMMKLFRLELDGIPGLSQSDKDLLATRYEFELNDLLDQGEIEAESASAKAAARKGGAIHQAVDETKILDAPEVTFHADLRILWPNFDQIDTQNENNNSVVLAVTLGKSTIVLTGDAEAENWPEIVPRLPATTTYLQVPHHGGRNGVFDPHESTPWLDRISHRKTRLVMSSHIVPHGHPHPDVVSVFAARRFVSYRTDRNYHITLSTTGDRVSVGYSHVSGRLPH